MITSIEPGTYRPGKWGVRIENLVINRSAETTEFGEFLDVALREGAYDRSLDDAAQDAGRVLHRFSAAKLRIGGGKKENVAAQFADADFEANPCAGGRFAEEQRPRLMPQGVPRMLAALGLHGDGEIEDAGYLRGGERFDGEQVFHPGFSKPQTTWNLGNEKP